MSKTTITVSGFQYSFDEARGTVTDASGRSVEANVSKISDGEFSVLIDGASYHFFVTRNSDPAATVDNYVYEIQHESLRDVLARQLQKDSGAHSSAITMRAPMPGLITKILKTEGTQINAGEGIVVIEAMKMENELKSPKAGTVKKIYIKEKQTVEKNDNLFIIE